MSIKKTLVVDVEYENDTEENTSKIWDVICSLKGVVAVRRTEHTIDKLTYALDHYSMVFADTSKRIKEQGIITRT